MKVLKWIQRGLLVFGVIAIGFSVGSTVYSKLFQHYASAEFDEAIVSRNLARTVASANRAAPGEGDPIARLEIPRLGVSVMVLEGVETGTLRLGAGHVPGTSLPGADGNVVIAAHRDSFFRNLEGIRVRDRIQVSTIQGAQEYDVSSTEIVHPEDVAVLASSEYSELTLITCYPFHYIGSAPSRFIVHARLVR